MSTLKKLSSAVGGLALAASGFSFAIAAAPAASAAPSNLAYVPMSPTRICDTRPVSQSGQSGPCTGKTLGAGATLTVDVPSLPAGAAAVEVNVTATNTAGQGFFTVFPAGGSNPGTSNLNFTHGQTASNLVTVGLGTDSSTSLPAISIFNGPSGGTGGNADVVVDLEGAYVPVAGAAGQYFGLTPARIADSRCGRTPNGAGSDCAAEAIPSANASFNELGAGSTATIQATGVGGIPSTGVSAVVLGVTVTNATAPSYLSTFAGGGSPGLFSNVNFAAGQTVASKVVVPVSASGTVSFFNHAGNVDVVVDADGYFSSSSSTQTGSLFTPLASPVRVEPQTTVGPGASVSVTVAGQSGVPTNANAGVFNLTDVQPTLGNFLTGYPTGPIVPPTSDVNWVPADPYNVVADAAFGTLSSGGSYSILNGPSDTKNNAGPAGVIADLFGYFTPAPTTTANQVTVTANPSTLPAGSGQTSSVVASVTTKATSAPVSGDTVTFTSSGSGSGVCGTLSPTSGTTGASGTVTVTYTAGTAAGTCTITATESGGASATVAITQTPPPAQFTLTASPATIPANNTATSTVTASVLRNGAPLVGDEIQYVLKASVPGACNLTSDTPPGSNLALHFGATGAAGQNSFTFVAGSIPGTCTVTATEADFGEIATTVITLTSPVYNINVTVSPGAIFANNNSTTTVTATVTFNGTPVSGDNVHFSTTNVTWGAGSHPGGTCNTLPLAATVSGINTNASGQASFQYTSNNTPGFCAIGANESVDGIHTNTPGNSVGVIDQENPAAFNYAITAQASPNSIPADGGISTAFVVATVTKSAANVNNDEVEFTAQGSAPGVCALTTDPTPVAGPNVSPDFEGFNGVPGHYAYQFPFPDALVSGKVPGTCTITATEAAMNLQATTTITLTPVFDTVSVASSPPAIVANGTSTSTVTATVTLGSTPVAGDKVTFVATPHPGGACSALPAAATTGILTNASGQASFTYNSTTTPGFCSIAATEHTTGSSGAGSVDQLLP
jgi:hypothetical protein